MNRKWWCGFSLLAATCLPVLLLSPFPTQDGPAHLYSAHVSRHLGDPTFRVLAHFFEPSSASASTWTVHELFVVLLGCVGPVWAEKAVALLFIAAVFAVFLVDVKGTRLFPTCALPLFVYSFVFRMGFYSFCLSIPLVLCTVSLWMYRPDALPRWRIAVVAACLAVLPLMHLVAAGWTFVILWSSAAVLVLVWRRISFRALTPLIVGSIPFLLAVVAYPLRSKPYVWETVGTRLAGVVAGGSVVAAGPYAMLLSAVPSAMLLALAVLFVRDGIRASLHGNAEALSPTFALLVGLVLVTIVPEEAGGGAYIGVRCNLLFSFLILVLLRRWELSTRADAALSVFFIAVSLAHIWNIYPTFKTASAAQRSIAESRAVLQDHAAVVVVVAGEWVTAGQPEISTQVRPLLHAGDLLGMEGDRAVLTSYQADIPYFPINFRRNANPFSELFDSSLFGWRTPAVRWGALPTWQGGVDYVGVWGEEGILDARPDGLQYRTVVCASYEEVYRSRAWPWVVYHVRRGDSGSSSTPGICH